MKNNVRKSMGTTTADMVRELIGGRYILDYGIIEEILADGVIMVAPSVIRKKSDYMAVPCVLGTTASQSLTVSIEPKVNDKVIVFYPKTFDGNMFRKQGSDTLVNPYAQNYSPYGGIAFLMNQYQTAVHKNTIVADEGEIKADLFYDANTSKHKIQASFKADGSINIHNEKATFSMDKDGNVNIECEGSLNLKNDKKSLRKIFEDLVTQIKNLQTYGSPANHTVMPSSQQAIDSTVGQDITDFFGA